MADSANPFGAPSAPSDSPQNPCAATDDNSSTTSLEPLGRPPDDAPSGLALGRASSRDRAALETTVERYGEDASAPVLARARARLQAVATADAATGS